MKIDIKANCGKVVSLEIKEDDIRTLLSIVEKEAKINGIKNYDELYNIQKKLDLLLAFNREPDEDTCEKLSLLFSDEYNDDLQPIERIRISTLGFSSATFKCLDRANIKFLDEILYKSDEELLKIRYLGVRTLEEIKSVIQELGYNFISNK